MPGLLLLILVMAALWLTRRSDTAAAKHDFCPRCGGPIQPVYLRCPHCGQGLKSNCPSCSRVVDGRWTYCPFCSLELNGKGRGRGDEKETLHFEKGENHEKQNL